MLGKNYYEILEIARNASIAQIKKQYRKLAKIYHPDKNGGDKVSEDNFKMLQEAYETLLDPKKRMEYDAKTFKIYTNVIPQNDAFQNYPSNGFHFSPQEFFGAVVMVLLLILGLIFLTSENRKSR
jgi:DnaJ-class molecular chaperone